MARTLVSAFTGLVAVLVGVANAVLMLVLTGSLASEHQESFALPLVAAILQIISCCSLTVLVLLKICSDRDRSQNGLLEPSRRRYVLASALGVLPSVVAHAVVGSALGWCEASTISKNLLIAGTQLSIFLAISFIVLGLAILTDVLYYATFAWKRTNNPVISTSRLASETTPQLMSQPSRPTTAASAQSNPFHEQLPSLPSSPPSLVASDGISSLRSSFSTVQRPQSSKKGFVIRQNSYTRHSARSSTDGPSSRPSQDEGFDSWDMSAVSSQIRETVLQSKPTEKGFGLEPIPGSRSPSPAKALEGPFFQSSPSISPPPSPLPQPSVSRQNSPTSSPIDFPNYSAMFPPSSPTFSRPSHQRHFSRPGSQSGPVRSNIGSRSRAPSAEENIHPLFRSDSPTPPPSASVNTNVNAAPGAGVLVSERALKRMRSGSIPASPSPLIRSLSSSDIRNTGTPLSPSVDTMPTPHLPSRNPSRTHQRKRSASFESCILK